MKNNQNCKIRKQLAKLRAKDEEQQEQLNLLVNALNKTQQAVIGLEAMLKHQSTMKEIEFDRLHLKFDSLEYLVHSHIPNLGETLDKVEKEYEASQSDCPTEPNHLRNQAIQWAKDYCNENSERLVEFIPAIGKNAIITSVYDFDKRETVMYKLIQADDVDLYDESGDLNEKHYVIEKTTAKTMREDVSNAHIGRAICLAKMLGDEEALHKLSYSAQPHVAEEHTIVRNGRFYDDTDISN